MTETETFQAIEESGKEFAFGFGTGFDMMHPDTLENFKSFVEKVQNDPLGTLGELSESALDTLAYAFSEEGLIQGWEEFKSIPEKIEAIAKGFGKALDAAEWLYENWDSVSTQDIGIASGIIFSGFAPGLEDLNPKKGGKLGKLERTIDKLDEFYDAKQANRLRRKYDQKLEKQKRQNSKGTNSVSPTPGYWHTVKSAGLPTTGIKFVPPKSYSAGDDLPVATINGKKGYLDKFGNVWVKPKGHAIQGEKHWDVQLGERTSAWLRQYSNSGKHVNITRDGRIAH